MVGPGNDVPGKSPQRLSFQDSCDIGSGPVRYSRVEVRAVAWCRRVGDGHKVRMIVGRRWHSSGCTATATDFVMPVQY